MKGFFKAQLNYILLQTINIFSCKICNLHQMNDLELSSGDCWDVMIGSYDIRMGECSASPGPCSDKSSPECMRECPSWSLINTN